MTVFTAYTSTGREAPDPVPLNDLTEEQVLGSLALRREGFAPEVNLLPHDLRSRLAVAISVCEALLSPQLGAGLPHGSEQPPMEQRIADSSQRERTWALLNIFRRMSLVVDWAIDYEASLEFHG